MGGEGRGGMFGGRVLGLGEEECLLGAGKGGERGWGRVEIGGRGRGDLRRKEEDFLAEGKGALGEE